MPLSTCFLLGQLIIRNYLEFFVGNSVFIEHFGDENTHTRLSACHLKIVKTSNTFCVVIVITCYVNILIFEILFLWHFLATVSSLF